MRCHSRDKALALMQQKSRRSALRRKQSLVGGRPEGCGASDLLIVHMPEGEVEVVVPEGFRRGVFRCHHTTLECLSIECW